ncbi:MAG: MBL fold metallo-hydrolase [Calditrichaeota bacterium]|nr:MBL fold metallo-hydrolase [Calditrichota bacterium]HQU71222.1 MBL fold metallo-hydrolase [Calditrichia bacterium]
MATLSFYGAAGTVTGSRHFLELGGKKLLIDSGLFQGSKSNRLKNWEPFPIEPGLIDRVLLTHAHIDHIGYLPRLFKDGFSGAVHCTHGTRDLAEILLKDSAHLQQEEAAWANKRGSSKHKPALPLYSIEDAERVLSLFSPVHYGQDLYLDDHTRVKFKDAGHILGASMIDIKVNSGRESKKILFSGDMGRAREIILRDPTQVFDVDYLVMESTYGDRLHEESDTRADLAKVINESIERGGVLLIPAFSVGRTQTILFLIRELEEEGLIPSIPIYVDSPMAIDATAIFRKHIPDLNLRTRILKLEGKKVFSPQRLKFCKTRDESKAINHVKNRAIVISASGMVTGGRILHHMINRLPHRENTVLFVGYQAVGTRGRTIVEGNESVKIFGEYFPIRARIESISGFSGHADYHEILAFLMAFNKPPEKTFLVHGEPEAAQSLQEKIRNRFGWDVHIAQFGESFELKI